MRTEELRRYDEMYEHMGLALRTKLLRFDVHSSAPRGEMCQDDGEEQIGSENDLAASFHEPDEPVSWL